MNQPRVNILEWSVSELAAALKKTVEDAYGFVRVRGEITGYRGPHSSGHVYFALKDEGAKIDAVIWRAVFTRIRFKPEEGLEVIATGRLTTYPGRSSYQIIVESLEPAGVGALMALLEERKKKLAAEGLFDEARKQLLPYLPNVIGVVTSPTGAVIRDILHRLADRFPRRVLLWPVRVQGEGSAEEVAAAIRGFNALPETGRMPRPDVIIVARGGGSLEDLWSFNEEVVVRAAAESMIPLISAVGHETDVTLIDFASDRRAPTPTAAAEMAVPVRIDLLTQIDGLARRQISCWARGLDARRTELRAAARALPSADALLAVPRQKLDTLSERLPRALKANAEIHHKQYLRCAARLSPQLLRSRVRSEGERVANLISRARRSADVARERRRERLAHAGGRLAAAVRANLASHRQHIVRDRERVAALFERGNLAITRLIERRFAALERADRLLAAFSYQSVLARGFALVRDPAGPPLRSAAAIKPGQPLDIEFADGRVAATATAAHGVPVRPRQPIRPRARRPGPAEGQGNLFG
ncbi:MAG TPA: exodeoxyribonuclease VII large subunit [Xanthobacteraceae bacterium]|nr:exodeoxyribonuclease VII large subunit [Xanthobacteraceae bacterium]